MIKFQMEHLNKNLNSLFQWNDIAYIYSHMAISSIRFVGLHMMRYCTEMGIEKGPIQKIVLAIVCLETIRW